MAKSPWELLTTSQAEEDIARSYAWHANAYVSKPEDYHRFREAVRRINDFPDGGGAVGLVARPT